MFHTLDKTEISVLRDFGEPGEKTWPYVELANFDCYFMCIAKEQIDENGEKISVNRSFLFSFAKAVSDLIDQQNRSFKVRNIIILRPQMDHFEETFEFLKVTKLLRGKNGELSFVTENNDEINFGVKSSNMMIIYECT